jgi:hypothetical protein
MPLPAACRWRVDKDGAFLDYHYGNVAYIRPDGARWRTVIQWRDRIYEGHAASLAQGMRWVTRWVEAAFRHGGPSNVRRWDVEYAARRRPPRAVLPSRADRVTKIPHPGELTMRELERIVGQVDIRQ